MDTKPFVDKVLKELGVKMEYTPKVERAVYGTPTSKGLVGGVGEEANASVILAKYDQLGGYMTKGGYKVKGGIFVNPKTGVPIENPKIVFLIKVNGEFVEQPEGEKESLEVQIAKRQVEEKKKVGRPKKEVGEETV